MTRTKPPTTPTVLAATAATAATAARAPARIAPGAMVPDLTVRRELRNWYWCGCRASLPLWSVDLAGTNFPHRIERVFNDPADPSRTIREPKAGCLVRLAREDVERFAAQVAKRVVRFKNPRDAPPASHVKANQVTPHAPPKVKCELVRLMSAADLDARRRGGHIPVPYHAQPGDRPLADFLYLVRIPHEAEEAPALRSIDELLPPPVSQAGVELPDEQSPAPAPAPRAIGSTASDPATVAASDADEDEAGNPYLEVVRK
jgi:hypothetical protein